MYVQKALISFLPPGERERSIVIRPARRGITKLSTLAVSVFDPPTHQDTSTIPVEYYTEATLYACFF